MILLRRGTALTFLLIFTTALIAMGVYGYNVLGGDSKEAGERILYIAIVASALVIVVFLAVVGKTLSLYRELDKMIALNKRGDFSPELSMKKLGPIGERITLLYFTLNALNDKKTLKIGALSSLADLLLENVKVPLFVTDVQGQIVYISAGFTERTQRNRADMLHKSATDLFSDVAYRDAVLELEKKRSTVEIPISGNPVILAGVHNRMNEISYVVWFWDQADRRGDQRGDRLDAALGALLPRGEVAKKSKRRRIFGRRG